MSCSPNGERDSWWSSGRSGTRTKMIGSNRWHRKKGKIIGAGGNDSQVRQMCDWQARLIVPSFITILSYSTLSFHHNAILHIQANNCSRPINWLPIRTKAYTRKEYRRSTCRSTPERSVKQSGDGKKKRKIADERELWVMKVTDADLHGHGLTPGTPCPIPSQSLAFAFGAFQALTWVPLAYSLPVLKSVI